MNHYKHRESENKWQKRWLKEKTYSPGLTRSKRPFYNLMMFPYPSAEGLHIGNMYAFTGADIYGRFKRMQGQDVFEPIGLDGFGIHSENYAIKVGRHPKEHAKISEENFYRQLSQIGNGFSWEARLETYDPDYYKWTQWLFIQMFKAGLAYKGKAVVNWCPSCKTVLADEQVVGDGVCERCGTKVEKREMSSWFFRITKYADKLLAGIDKINWPEKIKTAQRQWIGRREGTRVEFKIESSKFKIKKLDIFTTRLDTIFGATFIVISPQVAKQWVEEAWAPKKEALEYIRKSLKTSEQTQKSELREKTGIDSSLKALNPANGQKIPIWISDYVVGNVGTGAIMGVPAHDERDYEFAKKFSLPINLVIEPQTGEPMPKEEHRQSIVAIVEDPKSKKYLTLNWGPKLGGLLFIGGGREEGEDEVETALREIKEETGYTNLKFISKTEHTHHHYYAFSKNVARVVDSIGLYFQLKGKDQEEKNLQKDERGSFKIQWSSKDDILAKMEDENHLLCFRRLVLEEVYTGFGVLMNSDKYSGMRSEEAAEKIFVDLNSQKLVSKHTSYHLRDWLISRQRYWGPPIPMVYCKDCGWQPVQEEELPVLLPDIKDFKPKGDGTSPLDNAPESWKRIKCPNCGKVAEREFDVSDTFLDSAWYFLRYPSVNYKKGPFEPEVTKKWLPVDAYIGGAEHAVLHLLYARFVWMMLQDSGFLPKELGSEPFPFLYGHGLIVKDGAKMSKSKGNVVVPDTYIEKYGADTLRTYLMFLGPYNQGGDFRDTGIEGMNRFLNRVWKLYEAHAKVVLKTEEDSKDVLAKMHLTIKKVTDDVGNFRYNTAIAALMEFVNLLYEKAGNEDIRTHSAKASRVKCAEWDECLQSLCLLIAPFAPFMAEEIWCEILGNKFSVHKATWPDYKEEFLKVEKTILVVQVNGKLRGQLQIKSHEAKLKDQVENMAKKNEKVAKWLEGKKIKKTVFVPGKLINFVT